MTWCRIIEAEGGPYLVFASETPDGWGIVTTWMANGHLAHAILPATEFRGKADCMEFLGAMRPENAINMRRAADEAVAMAVANEAIENVMRGGSVH